MAKTSELLFHLFFLIIDNFIMQKYIPIQIIYDKMFILYITNNYKLL